jgi:hypothetical protein
MKALNFKSEEVKRKVEGREDEDRDGEGSTAIRPDVKDTCVQA